MQLFEFIDVNIFFIKLGQSKRGFTEDKAKVNYYNLGLDPKIFAKCNCSAFRCYLTISVQS